MALINCPECNKEISDEASTCPNCGKPINTSVSSATKNKPKSAIIFTITGIVIFILSGIIAIGLMDILVEMKAQYVFYGRGAYPILNFIIEGMTWFGIILIGISIVLWIKYAISKNNK